MVDFEQETNYEVILERPFMRQMMVVQDWGFDRLYLRHDKCIVRVNLDDQSYKDVTKTPIIEDFESTTYDPAQGYTGEMDDASSDQGAWLCDLFEKAKNLEELERANRSVEEEAYKLNRINIWKSMSIARCMF